jgi:hypothetical protein
LGVEQHPTFKGSDTSREVVDSSDAIGRVRRVEKIPDVRHEDINDVAEVRLRLVGFHAVNDMLTVCACQQNDDKPSAPSSTLG